MESINIQADIRNFIEKNSTNALPPYKFEFIPYISEFENKLTNDSYSKIPKDIQTNVSQFISNVFFSEPPESEVKLRYFNLIKPDSIENRIYNEIEAMVNLAWQGKQLPEEERLIVRI